MTKTKLSGEERFSGLLERRKQTDSYWIELAKDDIANEIFDLMEQEKVSKAELSRRLGVSRAHVSQILQGSANLTIETLVKIGLALGYRLRRDSFYVSSEAEQKPRVAQQKQTPAIVRTKHTYQAPPDNRPFLIDQR